MNLTQLKSFSHFQILTWIAYSDLWRNLENWLSQIYSEWRQTWKAVDSKISAKNSRYAILVKVWKWLKLLNSFPFIKKTLINDLYNWIWSFWLTFTVLQWMKANIKLSQFSRFLLKSEYVIHFKIWKWLKLLNSFLFIKKTLANQGYIRIWSFWVTFTASILVNLKISAKVRVCDFGQNLKMTKTS